jgi:hypothetical protein
MIFWDGFAAGFISAVCLMLVLSFLKASSRCNEVEEEREELVRLKAARAALEATVNANERKED